MIIRPYKQEDFSKLKQSLKESGLDSVKWDHETLYQKQIEQDPDSVIVAEDAGRIVGVVLALYNPWRSFIMHLGVSKNYQKRGVGTKLLEAAEQILKNRGIKQTTIVVEKKNSHLLPYYEKRGWFTVVETTLMEKKL